MQRRNFLKAIPALSSLPLVSDALQAQSPADVKGPTILFQGDSITDGNRSRNKDWNHVMGHGYQYIIASKLWFEQPEQHFTMYNRGISGNKVTDLLVRWDTDTIQLEPTILSILIGINDVEAGLKGDVAFTATGYENDYRQLLNMTRDALPNVQLIIGEPFVLPVGRVKQRYDDYQTAVGDRQEISRMLAKEFSAIHVPYQKAFNDALKRAEASYWIWDGIHPMPAGHELMAREWIRVVGKEIPFIR